MRKFISALLLICVFSGLALAQENEQDGYAIALQRIEEAGGFEPLDLSNLGLETVPPEIGQHIGIQIIDLSNNRLSSLPPEIEQLPNQVYLYLDNNQFTSFPAHLPPRTRMLSLNSNQISVIPDEVLSYTELCIISLNDNQIRELPEELPLRRDCQNGFKLSLKDNPTIPAEILANGNLAVINYLRDESIRSVQRLLLGGLSFIGMFAGAVLGLRWKNRCGKTKRKNEG